MGRSRLSVLTSETLTMSSPKLGPPLWLLCLQYFAAEAIVISHWTGTYSLSGNYISDLAAVHCEIGETGEIGAICSPWHALMNASFVAQGFLILGGVWLNRAALPANAAARLGLGLLAISSLGIITVGLAPEDTAPDWHYLGAAEHFVTCNLGTALVGLGLMARARPMAIASVAAGGLGLTGLACLGAHLDFGLGVGIVERITAYPFTLWLAGMGLWLMRR